MELELEEALEFEFELELPELELFELGVGLGVGVGVGVGLGEGLELALELAIVRDDVGFVSELSLLFLLLFLLEFGLVKLFPNTLSYPSSLIFKDFCNYFL